jgi:hypothetical protein
MNHQLVSELGRYIYRQKHANTTVIEQLKKRVDDVVQNAIHLQQVQLRPYRVDPVENNLDLRVAYLCQKINEGDFKNKLQRNNKSHEKKRETGEVLHLYLQTVNHILHRLLDKLKTLPTKPNANSDQVVKDIVETHLLEIEAIRIYANECLQEIASVYKHKTKEIRLSRNNLGDVLQHTLVLLTKSGKVCLYMSTKFSLIKMMGCAINAKHCFVWQKL